MFLDLIKQIAGGLDTLERINRWREICPDITLRSTFIVGFPGETDEDFEALLDFLEEAKLDRVGAFAYSPVEGAAANELPGAVPEDVKQARLEYFMEIQAEISAAKLQDKIGKTLEVIIDDVDEEGAIGRTQGDAPEIDGCVYVTSDNELNPGDIIKVHVENADEHDLWGSQVQ